jgi:dTDP-3-amino-3,4,6-trideoxy-alpha-D-glucose transaminase
MERIPLNDFRLQWTHLRKAVLTAVERVGKSGQLILGPEVACFEEELARYCGLPFSVGCASGLDAIEISLRCLGLNAGEKVLTTPLSAFATTLAIMRAGGVPVFVDVDDSGILDLELAGEALAANPDVRFLVPVHLYGHAMNLERLAVLKQRFDLRIVEDCAQAIGARNQGTPVGSIGQLAATSFYPTKNLGCMGDGGAVLTSSASHAKLARSLRDYGQTAKYRHTHFGMNSRLDELQAAILREAFLPALREFTTRRTEIAARYRAEITNPTLSVPPPPDGSDSVWHLFPILVSRHRESLQNHLLHAGIHAAIHYPRLIPDQEALKNHVSSSTLTPLPKATRFAQQELSLPVHPFLHDLDVQRVIRACNTWRD